jgi:hypothetical protein
MTGFASDSGNEMSWVEMVITSGGGTMAAEAERNILGHDVPSQSAPKPIRFNPGTARSEIKSLHGTIVAQAALVECSIFEIEVCPAELAVSHYPPHWDGNRLHAVAGRIDRSI